MGVIGHARHILDPRELVGTFEPFRVRSVTDTDTFTEFGLCSSFSGSVLNNSFHFISFQHNLTFRNLTFINL